jgi:hypothetical protein
MRTTSDGQTNTKSNTDSTDHPTTTMPINLSIDNSDLKAPQLLSIRL